jgi:hypothetical protein
VAGAATNLGCFYGFCHSATAAGTSTAIGAGAGDWATGAAATAPTFGLNNGDGLAYLYQIVLTEQLLYEDARNFGWYFTVYFVCCDFDTHASSISILSPTSLSHW